MATSFWWYLTDTNKLEVLLKYPLSTEVQHRGSVVAKCLYYILTSTEYSDGMAASSSNSVSCEVATTLSTFMTVHGSWLTQQLQHVTHYFNNKYVMCCI